jgi:hypothetical protein
LHPSGRLGRLMAYARVPRQRPFRRLPHHATQLPLCFEVFEASMDAGRAPRADQQSYAKIIAPYFSSIVQHRSSKCKFGQERRQPRGNRLRRPGVTRRRRPRWRASAPEGKPAEGPRRVHRRSAMHRAALRRIIFGVREKRRESRLHNANRVPRRRAGSQETCPHCDPLQLRHRFGLLTAIFHALQASL